MKKLEVEINPRTLEVELEKHTSGARLIPWPKGDVWEKWEKGEKGDKWDKGERWEQWPRWFNWFDGINGKDGKDGIDGKDWINGKDGKPWKQWPKWDDWKSFRFSDLTPYEKQILTWPQGSNWVGVPRYGTTGQVLAKRSSKDFDTEWITGWGGGAVDSVNWKTGVVVLNQDDVGDGTTYKQYSQTEKTKLAGIEAGAEVNNISDANATDLTDGGDTTLHTHDSRYYTETETNTLLSAKQDTLVSGTNIKTINSTSLLGSGDLAVATTAQGALADSALQPWDIASWTITARADDINFSGGSDGDVLTVQADGSLALETPSGWSGTVTSVTSANADATVANTTTTPVITIVSAPKLTTARTIGTATGDVTSAGSSFDGTGNNTNAYTIANSAVTLAKMANLAQDQFIGRTTASTGVPETATITAAARTVLDDTTVGAMVDTLWWATSTGTGGLVRAGSPALITPSIAAITVSGGILTLPTGATDTLVSKNSTDTLTNKSISGWQITSAVATATTATGTNALYSATTTVNVSSATAPSSGQVLTATGASAATWQTPTAPVAIKQKILSCFETAARFTSNQTGTGANSYWTNGLSNYTNGTSGSYASLQYNAAWWAAFRIFENNPSFSMVITANGTSDSGSGSTFWGIGSVVVAGSGHTYTEHHIGFKALKVSSTTINLYWTVSDGTTESATSSLTTIADWDVLELFFVVTGTSNVAFYYRKNGGTLSSATNVTTNIPSWTDNAARIRFSTSNNSTAVEYNWQIQSFSYER